MLKITSFNYLHNFPSIKLLSCIPTSPLDLPTQSDKVSMYVHICMYVYSGKEEQFWLITGVKLMSLWKKQCLTVSDVATFHFKAHLEVFGYVVTFLPVNLTRW